MGSTSKLKNRVLELWGKGECALSGWCLMGSTLSAEVLSKCGFHAVVVDLQHGMFTEAEAISMLAGISTSMPEVAPFVRVRNGSLEKVNFALDAGALGLICPMINTSDEVRAFVGAARYPPRGFRSFAPGRAFFLSSNYLGEVNDEVVTLAMIETAQAMDNLEDIMKVEGLSGVFIGPSDLALALGHGPSADPTEPAVVQAIHRIRDTAHAHGKKVGMFCKDGKVAGKWAKQGMDFVVAGSDLDYVLAEAKSSVAAYFGRSQDPQGPRGYT